MARFTIRIDTPLPAIEAWARVLDLRAHGEVIPFTSVPGAAPGAAELVSGTHFVARTAWGPIGFDDRMVVDDITPPTSTAPGRARIRKEGNVVRGWVEVTVTPDGPAASTLDWVQEISVRGVPRALGMVTAAVGRAAYGLTLRRLLDRPQPGGHSDDPT